MSLQGGIRSASCRGSLPQARPVGNWTRPQAGRCFQGASSSLPQARWFPKTPAKAVVAQKTPIKVELVAGKTYRWCVCGRSKKQVRDLSPSP